MKTLGWSSIAVARFESSSINLVWSACTVGTLKQNAKRRSFGQTLGFKMAPVSKKEAINSSRGYNAMRLK
jgi:hypothetical protein